MFLRTKRQHLLHACNALEPVPAIAATAETWQNEMPVSGWIRETCQQLVDSSNVENLCTSGPLQFKERSRCKRGHGPVGQLQRNLAMLAELTGHKAPRFLMPIPKAAKKHQPLRHAKACSLDHALAIKEGHGLDSILPK